MNFLALKSPSYHCFLMKFSVLSFRSIICLCIYVLCIAGIILLNMKINKETQGIKKWMKKMKMKTKIISQQVASLSFFRAYVACTA